MAELVNSGLSISYTLKNKCFIFAGRYSRFRFVCALQGLIYMERKFIRRAEKRDISRIAEILVFVKRIKFRPIFQDDAYSFGELQVLSVAEQYGKPDILEKIYVYDDGIVKGLIHIEKNEIVELYIDYFFQSRGIGSSLIEYAKEKYSVDFLWALEKNVAAIRFYEAHGFQLTDTKKFEEGTTEYLVRMER